MAESTVHEGRNLKRIREIMGIKQEALALRLGTDWNQQKVSLLEQKEVIEPGILSDVAAALHIKPEAIKNFNEEAAIFNIQNNYEGSTLSQSPNYQYNYQPTFNPVDKVVELYERLLKEKDQIIERLSNDKSHIAKKD